MFYLARQTKSATEQTSLVAESVRGAVYAAVATQISEANRIFIDHPELRGYFYEGAQLRDSDSNRERVEAVAEHLLDYFDSVLMQLEYLPQPWPRDWWDAYIVDSFARSEVLCDYLAAHRSWYRPELADKMSEGLRERMQQSEGEEASSS